MRDLHIDTKFLAASDIPGSSMKPTLFWKNFKLGEELSLSGAFIYNGIRGFHELQNLNHADEIFEVLYHLAVGFERLMKIAIVLIEHDDTKDQSAFEESLITHSHQDLLRRIKKRKPMELSARDNDFLSMLARFYKTLRYDRFSLQSVGMYDRERGELLAFLAKHLQIEFSDQNSIFATQNDDRYKKFLRAIVLKISSALFKIIRGEAGRLNIYTYELRGGSKAETVFLGEADIPAEDVLWKELLIFFMNTKKSSGYLNFLRSIEPLPFDPALTEDYLACFQSDSAKAQVTDELESLYEDVEDKTDRLSKMGAVGRALYFTEDEEESGPFGDEPQEED
jgi:hypothetical protein